MSGLPHRIGALVFLVVLSLAFCLGCGPSAPPASSPSPILERELPAFKRPTVNAGSVDTGERGRIVVVKFFAKYCEPCMKTLPAAQRLSREHADVTFIGIAEDEYQADVDELIATFGLSFPIVHDRGNVIAGRFRVDALPATFVADAAGTIRWVAGPEIVDEGALEAAIDWVRTSP
jgi:thiol-disulfide isomerase/thioredoxin